MGGGLGRGERRSEGVVEVEGVFLKGRVVRGCEGGFCNGDGVEVVGGRERGVFLMWRGAGGEGSGVRGAKDFERKREEKTSTSGEADSLSDQEEIAGHELVRSNGDVFSCSSREPEDPRRRSQDAAHQFRCLGGIGLRGGVTFRFLVGR